MRVASKTQLGNKNNGWWFDVTDHWTIPVQGKEDVAAFGVRSASGVVAGGEGTTDVLDGHWHHIAGVLDRAAGETDLVAVTSGPGLIGALLVGVRYAAAFAWGRSLPLVAVDHLEGHMVSPLLDLDGGRLHEGARGIEQRGRSLGGAASTIPSADIVSG